MPREGRNPHCDVGQVDSVITVVTDCPPETGGTRSEATEGVDSFPFSLFRFPFIKLRGWMVFRFPFLFCLCVLCVR